MANDEEQEERFSYIYRKHKERNWGRLLCEVLKENKPDREKREDDDDDDGREGKGKKRTRIIRKETGRRWRKFNSVGNIPLEAVRPNTGISERGTFSV